MSTGKFNLLDLASRSGENVHSVMEGVLTYAPELRMLPTFPKAGITYSTLTRTELPSGDFRQVGGGAGLNKSAWKRETGSMALFEAQMEVPEDIEIAARAENADLITGDLLADEAVATVRGSAIRIGSQCWYGKKISADGFVGLSTQVDPANEIDAGGNAGADTSSAYLLFLDDNSVNPEGVHLLLGNGGRMTMSDAWFKQRLASKDDPTKFYMAYVNNFLSYLGFVVARKEAVWRIKNLDATHPLTDQLAAQLWSLVPIAFKAMKPKFRWWMNSQPQYQLQKSRSTVTVASPNNRGVAPSGVWPELPESIVDIPIELTDSLLSTERNGLKP